MRLAITIAAWLLAAAAGPTLADEAAQASVASAAKEVLRARCSECHGGATPTADIRVLIDESLVENGLIEPGRPDESRLFQVMTSTDTDVMPPENRPALTGEEIAKVRKWLAAGAHPLPDDVTTADVGSESNDEGASDDAGEDSPAEKESLNDDRGVLAVILAHVRGLPTEERTFYRYFSSRHLLRSGVTEEYLTLHRQALGKALNHLSRESELVVPQPLDDVAGGTVFAVDIRGLGWHRRTILPIDPEPAGDAAEQQALTPFDLVLLEYPYAVFQDDETHSLAVAEEFLRYTRQVRPIPFLRLDWFCSVALQPPLYHDLLEMPQTLSEFEEQLGVDTEANLADGLAKRAGITVSGVSRNNRVVERHPQSGGYYWKSHDFASNAGTENILVDPVDFVPSGGEMIFRLPNGMQGYFVSGAAGSRINAAPTSIVVDKHASDRVVRNGLGCVRCHARGIKSFHDNVHDLLEVLPTRPGFDKKIARRLYPGNAAWRRVIHRDRSRFHAALARLDIDSQQAEPLTAVTAAYLEQTLTADRAAAEIGLTDRVSSSGSVLRGAADQLAAACLSPSLTRLGLSPFAASGVIRRDSWEDNFDAAVRELGLGVPIVPINGHLKPAYLNASVASDVVLRTNKKNALFEVGDKMRVFVDNKSSGPIHVDLFGVSADGKAVRLGEASTTVAAGESLQFPPADDDPIEIVGGLGREVITLFASESPLPSSTIFRGGNVADRIVHRAYVLEPASDELATPAVVSDATDIVKKSLVIETK